MDLVAFALIISWTYNDFVVDYLLGIYDGSILDYLLRMDGVFVVYLFIKHDFNKFDKPKTKKICLRSS
jgi:hypothetical protein